MMRDIGDSHIDCWRHKNLKCIIPGQVCTRCRDHLKHIAAEFGGLIRDHVAAAGPTLNKLSAGDLLDAIKDSTQVLAHGLEPGADTDRDRMRQETIRLGMLACLLYQRIE